MQSSEQSSATAEPVISVLPVVEPNPTYRGQLSRKYPIHSDIQELFTLKFLIIRRKSGLTIAEQVIVLVPEFEDVVRKTAAGTAKPETTVFYPASEPSIFSEKHQNGFTCIIRRQGRWFNRD